MPSTHLRTALLEAGPQEVQGHRLVLIAASEAAVRVGDVKCLVYAALASAISVDDEDVYPMLKAAVVKANDHRPGCVGEVVDDLSLASDVAPLAGALVQELGLAMAEVTSALIRASLTMRDCDTVPPEWTDDPKA